MIQAGEDKAMLTQVLGKLNALPPGSVGEFTPGEIHALRSVLAARHAEPLGDKERGFLARVQSVVEAHTASAAHAAEVQRRKNVLLRGAIDKSLQGRAAEVSSVERALIVNTAAQLDAIADPSESHLRLRALVVDALKALEMPRDRPPPESPAADAGAPQTARPEAGAAQGPLDAEIFFAEGVRTRLREYADIPLDINARVIEHEGDVEISGNVPDDVALVVKEGGVIIHGQCGGSILATGPIAVHGNIAGPWTISATGNIHCERVLGGANLYAPHEKITCASMERPGRIFSGISIEVSHDVRGGLLIAPTISVAGAFRGAQAQVLKSLVCGHIEGDAREPAQVAFRNFLSAEDYHLDVSDQAWHHARELSRFRFRSAVGHAILDCVAADLRAVQLARLYTASGKPGIDLKSLRSLQAKAAYLAVTVAVGELLEQVLLEAMEMEGDAEATALVAGTDEAQAAVKFVERELALLSDDLTREPKILAATAAKHLANIAKKARDCAGNRDALEESGHVLLTRLTEWRSLLDAATLALGETAGPLRDAVGAQLYNERNPATLERAVDEAMLALGHAANSVTMRSLKALAERYKINHATYTQGVSEVAAELARIEVLLANEEGIQMGDGRRGERYVRADRFGPHVIVAASPGLAAPHSGGDDHTEGRVVRVDRELPGAARFCCDGLVVRRRML